MTRRSVFLTGAALALVGCGDDGADPQAPTTPAATPTATTAAADGPTSDERKLRRYLKEGFGGGLAGPGSEATWYDTIKSVTIGGLAGETIYVTTSLFNDADASEPARAICRAVLFGVPDLEQPITQVEVQDSRGDTITDCSFGG